MIDLETFNAERAKFYKDAPNPLGWLNNIACPKCGHEMIDTTKHVTFSSLPPKVPVRCLKCEFTSFRVA